MRNHLTQGGIHDRRNLVFDLMLRDIPKSERGPAWVVRYIVRTLRTLYITSDHHQKVSSSNCSPITLRILTLAPSHSSLVIPNRRPGISILRPTTMNSPLSVYNEYPAWSHFHLSSDLNITKN